MVIWPDANSAQNSIAAVSADGSTVWVLIRRLKLLVQPLDGIGRAGRSPLAVGQPGEAEQLLSSFLQAVGHAAALQSPLADEALRRVSTSFAVLA